MLGLEVQKQVAGVATPGFDDRLAQTANNHPVTCHLPFPVSLETEVHPHRRAGILPVCIITAYRQYQYSLCIVVYQNIDRLASTIQYSNYFCTNVHRPTYNSYIHTYHIAGEKLGSNAEFGILAGLNLADLQLYISHTHCHIRVVTVMASR